MHNRNEYRAKALEFLAKADRASRPEIREQLLKIAMAYVNLADFAEHTAAAAASDHVLETQQRSILQ